MKIEQHGPNLLNDREQNMRSHAASDGSDINEISMHNNNAPDQGLIFQMVFAALQDNSEMPSNVAEYAFV